MNILAFDSTGRVATVSVVRDGKPLSLFTVDSGLTQSELLLPLAKKALECAHLSLDEVDLYAVTVGPGSFTGVRIGTSLVKGLTFGREVPVAGVSVMEALGEALLPLDGIYCPVADARRAQVYCALFCEENGALVRLREDDLLPMDDLLSYLAAHYADRPIRPTGDAAEALSARARELYPALNILPVPPVLRLPSAVAVANCGARVLARGEAVDGERLAPVYLRLPQAERERLERLEKENSDIKGE